jgi:predicted RNase H-like HicB family nuclease
VAVGSSRQEVESLIREAIPAHISLMRQTGEAVPEPTAEGVIVVPAS